MTSPRETLYLVVAFFAVIIGVVLIFAPPADVCKDYLNPDDGPLPTEVYFDIPPECLNQARMYPDEEFTSEGGITYSYTEYPEMGAALITSEYGDILHYIRDGSMFRGRYAINDTHNFFIDLTTPSEYDWDWNDSPNATNWSWDWNDLREGAGYPPFNGTIPIPEGCYENNTGYDPDDLVIHMTCPEGVSP